MRVLVAVLAAVVWAVVVLRVLQWQAARTQGRTPREPRGRVPRPRSLPEGHRPPPGLGPLSPSERFLTCEAARGLRELQLFLVDQRAG